MYSFFHIDNVTQARTCQRIDLPCKAGRSQKHRPFMGIHTPKTVTALGRVLLTRKATLTDNPYFSDCEKPKKLTFILYNSSEDEETFSLFCWGSYKPTDLFVPCNHLFDLSCSQLTQKALNLSGKLTKLG